MSKSSGRGQGLTSICMWRKVQAIKPRERDRERGRQLTKCAARERFLRQLTDSRSNKNSTNLTGFATTSSTTTTMTMTTKTEAKPGQRLCLRLRLRLATTHLVSLQGAPQPLPRRGKSRHLQHGARWVIVAHMQGRMANKEILEV